MSIECKSCLKLFLRATFPLPHTSLARERLLCFLSIPQTFSTATECNKATFFVNVFRKKIENIGKMTQMTQDEIVTNTKTVLQGLEALRVEHMSIIAGLTEGKKDPDKADIIQKNIEDIELGLGEAQVKNPFMAPHLQIY
jgi:hypothetical protein